MSEVSDDDVRLKLRAVLKDTDLSTTTERKLREQLQEHFGCSLKDRKAIFKEEIESFLDNVAEPVHDDPVEHEEPSEDAASLKRPRGAGGNQSLSPELASFLQVDPDTVMARGEVVTRIYKYVDTNKLKDPEDKRSVLADDKLQTLFKFPLTMFNLHSQLKRHCTAAKGAKKAKVTLDADGNEIPRKLTGFAAPQKLSPDLAKLVGVDVATRGECQKLLWTYIKEKGLQKPEDKSVILVKNDELMHKVLGVKECKGFSMSKYLSKHFLGKID